MTLRYGFVGLGHLGGPLAACLGRAGWLASVHDRREAAAAPLLHDGARWAASPCEAANGVDAVVTCLPSAAASEAVLTGADGILAGLRPGGTWIEMSTLDPESIRRFADIASRAGVAMLEAPVTGGVHLATVGGVTVLAGGDAALLEVHRPALGAMGRRILHMGDLGSAAAMKVITNMLAFVHLQACGEALMLARRGGLDLAQAFHAIAASSGTSFVHETEGQLILNGSYDVGFSMDLACKDLSFALGLGRASGTELPLAALTAARFREAWAAYGGDAPSTMLVRLLEDALGTELRADGFPSRLEA